MRLRRLPLKGAEPGHKRSGEPLVPGEELGQQARRGLQGTPAVRRSRSRGVCWVSDLCDELLT